MEYPGSSPGNVLRVEYLFQGSPVGAVRVVDRFVVISECFSDHSEFSSRQFAVIQGNVTMFLPLDPRSACFVGHQVSINTTSGHGNEAHELGLDVVHRDGEVSASWREVSRRCPQISDRRFVDVVAVLVLFVAPLRAGLMTDLDDDRAPSTKQFFKSCFEAVGVRSRGSAVVRP